MKRQERIDIADAWLRADMGADYLRKAERVRGPMLATREVRFHLAEILASAADTDTYADMVAAGIAHAEDRMARMGEPVWVLPSWAQAFDSRHDAYTAERATYDVAAYCVRAMAREYNQLGEMIQRYPDLAAKGNFSWRLRILSEGMEHIPTMRSLRIKHLLG